MTAEALRAKWEARHAEWRRLRVHVDGAAVTAEMLADLAELERTSADEQLTLEVAAAESGYSADHLRHLVAAGTLRNAGAKGRPRIRRADLPKKPAAAAAGYDPDADALSITRRRLARG